MAAAATAVPTIQCQFFYHGLTTLGNEKIEALKITTEATDIIATLSHAAGSAARPLSIKAQQLSAEGEQSQDSLICFISELSKLKFSLKLAPQSSQGAETTVAPRSLPIQNGKLPKLERQESVHVVVYFPKEESQPRADFILPEASEETSALPVPTALIQEFQEQAKMLVELIGHSSFRIDGTDCTSILASMESVDAAMQQKMAAELDLLPASKLTEGYHNAQQALERIDKELEDAIKSKESAAIAKAAKACRECMGEFNDLATAMRRRNLQETTHPSYLHIIVEPDTQCVFFEDPSLHVQSLS